MDFYLGQEVLVAGDGELKSTNRPVVQAKGINGPLLWGKIVGFPSPAIFDVLQLGAKDTDTGNVPVGLSVQQMVHGRFGPTSTLVAGTFITFDEAKSAGLPDVMDGITGHD